jgi:dimethylargininase
VLSNEADRLTRVVVCSPREEYFLVSDLEEHNFAQLADRNLAVQQHDTLKSKIREFGSEVIDIPELANHPNSVFTRDTALSTPYGFIKLRLGLDTRRGEEQWMSRALESIGEFCVGEIRAPGTVEGGDVILAGSIAFVGRSIRTNDEGVTQLSSLLSAMDYEVRKICVPDGILHLDKVLMAAGPNRMLSCSDCIPNESLKGFDVIQVICGGHTTANIICLGNNELIVERSNREVITRLEANGLLVHAIDLSEFAKGTGGPNCLIMPIERKAASE